MHKMTLLRKIFFAVSLGLVIAVLAAGVDSAQARLLACRADPIVWLSDGSKLVITADIQAPESDVRDITYQVHGPKGTSVIKIVYTGKGLSKKETVLYQSDSLDSQYQADTVVSTRSGAVQVVVQARLTFEASPDFLDRQTMSGKSNAHIIIGLKH